MELHFQEKTYELPINDESYSYESIMALRELTLYFSSAEYIEYPVGSYCEFNGTQWYLNKPATFVKNGTRNYDYTMVLSDHDSKLTLWKVINPIDGRIKFSYTCGPREHLQLIVDCLNQHDAGWSVGKVLDGSEKTANYNHTYLLDGLNSLADLYETEWEINGKQISLCKVEYNKEDPLPLHYEGSKGSINVGVGRESTDVPTEVVLVEGAEKNIDYSTYGSKCLLLPKNQELEYEGRKYMTDKSGIRVMRADKELTTGKEDSLDCSEIYPARVGTVSEVITVDASKNFYDFKDASIPDNLDYSKYRITGERATVIFQSGMLAGQEFDIEQDDKSLSGYVHSERRFKIVPQEIDGIIMPNETYKPAVGDKYAVFGIMLPAEYICDNDSQTGASWDMFREAVRYLYEHEDRQFTFKGSLNGIWAKKRWLQIGGKLRAGGYVRFSDNQFHPDGSLVRITGIKRFVNIPHKPEIELSNGTVATSIGSDLDKIPGNEVSVDDKFNNAMHYTKRRYRDAIEAQEMLEAAFDNYTKGIDPIWVRTMSLLVGDESLQFRFVNSKTNPQTVDPDFVYSDDTKIFTAPKSILQHMTLGISDIKGEHSASEYKYWDIPAYTSPSLGEFGSMYFYAKCNKSGTSGEFILSETPYDMDSNGYYYFLVGLLGSQFDGTRSFVTVYGFTEILPGRITVDRIVSTDGKCYFNLGIGEIGGVIKFASGSTGYDNIADKPDLSIYGTIDMLNAIKGDLENQIDEKIETYYQSSNPWNSWQSGTEPTHVGDLWYNTNSRTLHRYVGPSSNTWERIYDQDAIDAAEAASNAQDTADGKRRVFLNTPYPPYDAGDQWITYGSSGSSMRICVRSRQSGSYVSTDWQLSDADGNVKVSIDRGVVSAAGFLTFGGTAGMVGNGTIRIWSGGSNADNATFKVDKSGNVESRGNIYIANSNGDKLAGFSGSGTAGDSVRIWAGNTVPASAPFKVYQSGNAYIGGLRMESGGLFSDNKYSISGSKFFLYSSGSSAFLGFSASGKWAGIGLNTLPSTTGTAALLRLENTNSEYGTKYGAVIQVSGGSHNVALKAVGHIRVNGTVIADTIVASEIRGAVGSINSDGSDYDYYKGVTFGYNDYDLDKARFQVQNGLIIGVKKE